MDFQSMKRRELQALCKINNIPANLTNAAMADALSSLPFVEGVGEFLGQPEVEGSVDRSVVTSPNAPRTTTHQKVSKVEAEGSKLATRTRCGTRSRAVEGTDTRKTTSRRTTRKEASHEPSVQKKVQEDLQAQFEADMEQSEASENSALIVGQLKGISEEISGGSIVIEQPSLDSHTESVNDDSVSINQEASNGSQKVDFHSLSRKDLQSLCKKNKIPANTTNATMADALTSLEIVEGLEAFLQERETQSPPRSELTSSCARRTWTSRRVSKEPTSSKLITKSCRGTTRKVIEEEFDQANDAEFDTSVAPSTQQKVAELVTAVANTESTEKCVVQTYCRRRPSSSTPKKSEGLAQEDPVEFDSSKSSDVELKNTGSEDTSKGIDASAEGHEVHEQLDLVNKMNTGECLLENNEESEIFSGNAQLEELVSSNSGVTINGDASVEGSEDSKDFTEVESESESVISPLEGVVSSVSADSQMAEKLEASAKVSDDDTSVKYSEDTIDFSEVESESESEVSPLEDVVFTDSADSKMVEMLQMSAKVSDNDTSVEGLEESAEFSEVESEIKSEIPPLKGMVSTDSADSKMVEKLDNFSCTKGSGSDASETGSVSDSEFSFDVCLSEKHGDSIKEDELSVKTGTKDNYESDAESNLFKGFVAPTTDFPAYFDDACKSSDSEPAILANAAPGLVNHEKVVKFSDPAPDTSSNVESTVEADQGGPKGKETPLQHKSLRKLRRMVKEKLQATTTSLENEMEKLTLEKNDIPTADCLESEVSAVNAENNEDPGNAGGQDVSSENLHGDVDASVLYPVNVLVDNEMVSESSVAGPISTVCDQVLVGETTKSSSEMKPLFSTPSKSACKIPISVGKTCVLDMNKENIDTSACKTEPGKIYIAAAGSGKLLSAMSMGKLKKECKKHSEIKRQALQSRSENCRELASP